MQKTLIYFQQKIQSLCDIYFQNFNETLTNGVVYFEQLGPDVLLWQEWEDPRLSWSELDNDGINAIFAMQDTIWKPQTVIDNS